MKRLLCIILMVSLIWSLWGCRVNGDEALETGFQAIVDANNIAEERARVMQFAADAKGEGVSFELEVTLLDGTTAKLNGLDDLSSMAAVRVTVHHSRGVFHAPLWYPKSEDNVYLLLRE